MLTGLISLFGFRLGRLSCIQERAKHGFHRRVDWPYSLLHETHERKFSQLLRNVFFPGVFTFSRASLVPHMPFPNLGYLMKSAAAFRVWPLPPPPPPAGGLGWVRARVFSEQYLPRWGKERGVWSILGETSEKWVLWWKCEKLWETKMHGKVHHHVLSKNL